MDSALGKGSRFSFLLPLTTEGSSSGRMTLSTPESSRSPLVRSALSAAPSRANSRNSRTSEIDNLVEALSSSHMEALPRSAGGPSPPRVVSAGVSPIRTSPGRVEVPSSVIPIKPVKIDQFDLDPPAPVVTVSAVKPHRKKSTSPKQLIGNRADHGPKLRILVVEVSVKLCFVVRGFAEG